MMEDEEKIHHKDKNRNEGEKLWEAVVKDVCPIKHDRVSLQNKNNSSHSHKETKEDPQSIRGDAGYNIREDVILNSREDVDNKSGNREVDYNTKRRLKRGQIHIDAKIDLHGMSQIQAYDTLLRLLPEYYRQKKRCVLVVTGKGLPRHGDVSLLEQTTGILKQKAPEWLNMPPLDKIVLNIQSAIPKHGGEGAIYVLLRKNRNK